MRGGAFLLRWGLLCTAGQRRVGSGHCFRDASGGDLRILHPTSSKLRPPQRSRIDLRSAQLRAFCRTDVAGHAAGVADSLRRRIPGLGGSQHH